MSRFVPVKVLLIAAVLVSATATPAQARPAESPQLGVFAITDRLARLIAVHGNPHASLAEQSPRLATAINTANKDVLAAKGLPASGGSVLRIRLADPAMRAALALGAKPLVAATPTDDTTDSIVGYDSAGKAAFLDAAKVPWRPVYLVEVDVAKAMPLGISVIEQRLGTRAVAPMAGGYWATKVNAVRLSDDEEPWFKGGAEVYSIVGGFGLNGHPAVNVVQMPYLDHDGTTYYPNQLLVHFSAYKYNLADVVMMEDDGDTNYQQLAIAIANALLTIVDGGAYAPLVSAILSAIPTSWWTDDPDYVDSWYTLATYSGGRLNGARANGWMDVSPYWVAPL